MSQRLLLLLLMVPQCAWAQDALVESPLSPTACEAPLPPELGPPHIPGLEIAAPPESILIDLRGLGVFGGGLGECGEGWNACPCEEECQQRRIAACEKLDAFLDALGIPE